jgi:catechol 2,3-dioxygenase-like lactoylglutathione lyase family enzyme
LVNAATAARVPESTFLASVLERTLRIWHPRRMLTALDHVIVAVADLEAASRDYRTILGLEPSWHGEHPGAGTANVLFRLGNTYVELLAPRGEGPLADLLRMRLGSEGEGLAGLAFATDDLESCRTTLAERGFRPGPVEAGSGRDTKSGAERTWSRLSLPADRTRGLLLFPIRHESPATALPMAKPTGDPAASVHALDHVVVQTTDAEAAIHLFAEGLGLRLAVDKEFESWGVRLMFFRVGGLTVEVAAPLATGASPLPDAASDRIYGMSYRVASVEAARERLATAGVDVSEVRKGRRPGTRVCSVRSATCGVPTLMIEFESGARA